MFDTDSENGYFVHNTLTIHQVHHSDSGLYHCYVANTNGTSASMTNLTVVKSKCVLLCTMYMYIISMYVCMHNTYVIFMLY